MPYSSPPPRAPGTVVRIRDLAGRPRGTGFVVDAEGTVLTSHEAVDGLARLVLHAPGDAHTWLVESADVTSLPSADLAVVRARGLAGARAFALAAAVPDDGTEVAVALPRARVPGRVVAAATATYTATDRYHLVDGVLQLALAPHESLRAGGEASGAPVVDAASGAVVAVVGTALHADRGGVAHAVPLRGAADDAAGTLGAALDRGGAQVPAYGRDLNLAGAVELGAAGGGAAAFAFRAAGAGGAGVARDGGRAGTAAAEGGGSGWVWGPAVERREVGAEFGRFFRGDAHVLALVGGPGTGRSTELAGLAARRAAEGAPSVRLRGADLKVADAGVRDAVARALRDAARAVAVAAGAAGCAGDPASATPEAVAAQAHVAGRPLLVLLDGPEEMPPVLAAALGEWTAHTAEWLVGHGVRLVLACRPEFWERAGALFPAGMPHAGRSGPDTLPPCVPLGDFTPAEAAQARTRYSVPPTALHGAEARHPLTLRLLAEVRAALPRDTGPGSPGGPGARRWEVFESYLAVVCLRIAERLAREAGPAGPRGAALGRLAVYVAGQAHEAARRCLGPGQGELERAAFEELFPWRVPDHLAGLTGWASAVLAEGLLVPAGAGYRFAHEEFADWLQGAHLDVDAALAVLVHRTSERWRPGDLPSSADGGAARRALPVPPHRIGACVEALLLLERRHGGTELGRRLSDLLAAADAAVSRRTSFPEPGPGTPPGADGGWWAAHLLGETLLRVPDARPYRQVLRRLAACLAGHAARFGGTAQLPAVLAPFGPSFFTRLPLPLADRLDLLRRLVPADTRRPSAYLTAAGELLHADPATAQPLLTGWFGDERALPADGATVADAAQALLHTHRARAVDDLADALVATAHPRAGELLAALAEDEPSALCRAVDRWARDPRPERRAAAATYAQKTARHARGAADRALLRYAARALLAHTGDDTLHGPALAVLLRDPESRAAHLDRALALLAADDPHLGPADFAPALATHPGPVLDAFRDRLHRPGDGAADVLRTLARLRAPAPALARGAADLVREYVDHHPEGAAAAADFVDRRLEHGQGDRAVLLPLAVELLTAHSPVVRRALAPVVADPGTRASGALRRELLAVLLDREREPAVLDALLAAVGRATGRRAECATRDLVRRIGLLLSRTPEGAAVFDRRLVALAAELPAFAAQLGGWLAADRDGWAVLLGPSAQLAVGTAHPRRAS
ncbi:hypothetical protein AA958_26325 [Streptomyces sp. CNQ-509]|uniref:trypsin-like peptidase domain-containing protein n=1 Tax=Streptomyces sp. CNQ-509 TaxID=444103 RepID=UPI00062DDF90|nr:trypsin-like peptidase domain-containing protein [Streptomyces sp. CNQ-509]AKH85161.1 hypothetical protein AA958_26325 [Streptomyces sp. CNQ-509]